MLYNEMVYCISIRKSKGKNILQVSYKKLWKLLIDKEMKKKDLPAAAGIAGYPLQNSRKERLLVWKSNESM